MKKHLFKKSPIKSRSEPKASSAQFPSFFLTFTEKYFLVVLVSFVLLLMIVVVGLDLYKDIKQIQKAQAERQKTTRELQFWQLVVSKYKDYRDAYFQIALLEYRLGNFNKSRSYLQKTLSLDPNFEKGRELEKVLSIK